jgi:hypothetical protein
MIAFSIALDEFMRVAMMMVVLVEDTVVAKDDDVWLLSK